MAAGVLVAGALFAPGALAGRRRMVGRGALFALVTIVGAGLVTVLWTLVAGVDPVDLGGIILQIVAWFSAIGIVAGVIWNLLLRAIAKGNLRLGSPGPGRRLRPDGRDRDD